MRPGSAYAGSASGERWRARPGADGWARRRRSPSGARSPASRTSRTSTGCSIADRSRSRVVVGELVPGIRPGAVWAVAHPHPGAHLLVVGAGVVAEPGL